MFHFRLFPEKTKKNFFSKNPTIFGPLSPFLGKAERSSKFCSYQLFFLKKLSIIVPNFKGKLMSSFQATLVSDARMHTCMVQVYHETIHTSYHSDSEINFLSVN